MSEFTTLIARREVPTVSTTPASDLRSAGRASSRGLFRSRRRVEDGSLATLRVGDRAVVMGICADLDAAAVRRLVDLGFAPGATVEVIRRAPLADPTVFRVADTEIALRRRHAEAIGVERVDDDLLVDAR